MSDPADKLLIEIHQRPGWTHKIIDNELGGLLELKERFLKEAAEDSKGKTPEESVIIGWNKHCTYVAFHSKWWDSFRLYGERNPPVNY